MRDRRFLLRLPGAEEEDMPDKKTEELKVTEKEEKLIRLIRDLRFGEIKVCVADSQPVRLEEVRKSIKL